MSSPQGRVQVYPGAIDNWHFQIFLVNKFQIPHPLPFLNYFLLFLAILFLIKKLKNQNSLAFPFFSIFFPLFSTQQVADFFSA